MVEEVFTQVWSKPPFVVSSGVGWLCNRGEKQYYL